MLGGAHFFPFVQFQFHYGTIKRHKRSIGGNQRSIFQFHYGTIKSEPGKYIAFPTQLFQFHYGTIKSCVGDFANTYQSISIPLWYD